jgi:hypothetical protein
MCFPGGLGAASKSGQLFGSAGGGGGGSSTSPIPNPSAPVTGDSGNPSASTPTSPSDPTAGTSTTDPMPGAGNIGITPDAQPATPSPTGIAPGGNALAPQIQQHNAMTPAVTNHEHPFFGILRNLFGGMGGLGGSGGANNFASLLQNLMSRGGARPTFTGGAPTAPGAMAPGGPATPPGPNPMPPTPAPQGNSGSAPFANLFSALGGQPSGGSYSVG